MQKTSVGSIEVVALIDTVQSYAATMVYPELGDTAPFSAYLDSEGKVALNFACFLVRDGDTVLLVDTGWGPEYDGRMLAELAEAGVKPAQVTHVLFTHLHGDHTGWSIDRQSGKPIFSAARYLVPQADWEHYGAGDSASFERDVRPLKAAGCMDLVSGETAISKSLTSIPTPGHTPGHTSVAITAGSERGFILGDVVLTPIDAEKPELESVFDGDRPLAVQTRKKTIQRLISENALVGASHLPVPGLGRFVVDRGGQRWQPL
jgi:glyoxylase-like metal-dependent hydrolase (beta-lactamase superfamily II)